MKQKKLKLYSIDMKYVRDLHNVDDRVQSVSPQIHKSNRPFVGVVVVCEDHLYCIPLDHPKEKHLTMKNDVERTNKGVSLTEAGREFLVYAKKAVGQ